jgi:all-trans-retinol 13,14-reductase
MWDAIVIGSGMSGLVAAASLARHGKRVLGLEQHNVPGGLTQAFTRQQWTFATGLHYIAGTGPQSGPDGQLGRLLNWLSDAPIEFADCGNPYDIVRVPGFEFGIEHPETRYRAALHSRFAAQGAAIDAWFDDMAAARKAATALLNAKGMPTWMAWGLRHWRAAELHHWTQRSLADALATLPDPKLRAVLGARWGDYGAAPHDAPLLEHALVTGAYNAGSYYPVGGPQRLARALMPTVQAAGGRWELGASVEQISVSGGRVDGVLLRQSGALRREESRCVISTMGALNTVDRLSRDAASDWQDAVRTFKPGLSCLCLYLGLDGDIAAAGATAANVWIYEDDDVGRVWQHPADEEAPGLYVSFPSLKDPLARAHPTAEVLALCDAADFVQWMDLPDHERPEEYRAFKSWVQERLVAQFKRHFPALAPMIRYVEMSTPLTQRDFVRAAGGAMYGLEMTAERLETTALDVRTPVQGLLLAGQDVFGAGVPAAAMSGLLAAAAHAPALFKRLAM